MGKQAGVLPVAKAGGLVAGNLELWDTVEGSCPMSSAMLCESHSLSRKTVWLLSTTMCNRRQGSLLPKLVMGVVQPLQDI